MTITPAQVTFRHMPPSPVVEARIRDEVTELDRWFPRITSCHVVIDSPHHHHRPQARTFRITIELGVPRKRIIVNHEPSLHAGLPEEESGHVHKDVEAHPDHRDIYVCIRDAFKAVRRQLEDYARELRGETKRHEASTAPEA